jgi:hypothetical protein
MAPELLTALGFLAAIAANLGLYLAGMVGQLGQLTRDRPPAGKDG